MNPIEVQHQITCYLLKAKHTFSEIYSSISPEKLQQYTHAIDNLS
jgi:hypothetical protein